MLSLLAPRVAPQLSGCLLNDGMNVYSEAESSGPPFTVASLPEVPEVFPPKWLVLYTFVPCPTTSSLNKNGSVGTSEFLYTPPCGLFELSVLASLLLTLA